MSIEFGRDYTWYNLLSLLIYGSSLGFVLLVFVLDNTYSAFTIIERVFVRVILLDALLAF